MSYFKNVTDDESNDMTRGVSIAVISARDVERQKDDFVGFIHRVCQTLKWDDSCVSVTEI